jgi:hypothetical protein
MVDNVKLYNIMSKLCKKNNFNLFSHKDKIEYDRLKTNLNYIVFDCIVVAIASSYIYNKFLEKRAMTINKKRCLDLVFVLGLTSIISHLHYRFISKYDLKSLSNKYRYTLLNSILLEKKEINYHQRMFNLLCGSYVKHFYLIILLILRNLL